MADGGNQFQTQPRSPVLIHIIFDRPGIVARRSERAERPRRRRRLLRLLQRHEEELRRTRHARRGRRAGRGFVRRPGVLRFPRRRPVFRRRRAVFRRTGVVKGRGGLSQFRNRAAAGRSPTRTRSGSRGWSSLELRRRGGVQRREAVPQNAAHATRHPELYQHDGTTQQKK